MIAFADSNLPLALRASAALALACLAFPCKPEVRPGFDETWNAAEVVVAAGIGKLRETPLPDGSKEIRIWSDASAGVIYPNQMVQLKIAPDGKASGVVWWYYPSKSQFGSRSEHRQFLREMDQRCPEKKRDRPLTACAQASTPPPDWQAFWQRLSALDVETLPDESELPRPKHGILDGGMSIVEVRDGSRYRSYRYGNAQARTEPEAHKAHAIVQEMNKLIK